MFHFVPHGGGQSSSCTACVCVTVVSALSKHRGGHICPWCDRCPRRSRWKKCNFLIPRQPVISRPTGGSSNRQHFHLIFPQVLYEDSRMVTLTAPYIAGFLAFRETPFLLDALKRLQRNKPELLPQVQFIKKYLQPLTSCPDCVHRISSKWNKFLHVFLRLRQNKWHVWNRRTLNEQLVPLWKCNCSFFLNHEMFKGPALPCLNLGQLGFVVVVVAVIVQQCEQHANQSALLSRYSEAAVNLA